MNDIASLNADFEMTVLSVLDGALDKRNGESIIPYKTQEDWKSRLSYDFYLPQGCNKLSLPEKTFVEVKIFHSPYAIRNVIRQEYIIKQKYPSSEYVLITCDKTSQGQYKSAFIDSKIRVFSLEQIVCDHNDLFNNKVEKIEQYFSNPIKANDKKQGDEGTTSNDKIDKLEKDKLELARDYFQLKNNTLFLGAGVSSSANLPGWNDLMKQLMNKDDEGKKPFELINEASYNSINKSVSNSSIVTGRYVVEEYMEKYPDDGMQKVTKRIREILYKGKKRYDSPLLKVLADLMIKEHIKQVITYNYDNLLEQYIDKEKGKAGTNYISIYDSQRQRETITPIYHVHGLIEENPDPNQSDIPNAEPILSEKAYHQLYNSLQSWVNVVQLNALYTTHCFFIGFSMTDPNQRRLLDMARENEFLSIKDKDKQSEFWKVIPHFVFMKKDGLEGEASKDVNQEHWTHVESLMKQFGLNIIWVDDFKHLPELLKYMSGEISDIPEWYKSMQNIETTDKSKDKTND